MSEIVPVYLSLRKACAVPDLDAYGVPPEAVRAFSLAMGRYIIDDAHGLWYEPENGDGHSPDKLALSIGTRLGALCALYESDCIKSPIEAQMVSALLWMDMDWAGLPEADPGSLFDSKEVATKNHADCFITPQATIGSYRADILFWFRCGRARGGVVIECDGHEFHEKSKEQAARDKRRDREILTAGFPVMRFTGSEIYRDPVGCAEQVKDAADTVLDRVSRDGGLY